MKKERFLQAVVGMAILCLMLLACVPPFDRDGLIHHLQIPKLYLQHGGIYEIPELPFSYYPMNLDLLYMGALWLGSDILPKYIHMAFGLATAIILFFHLKKRLSGIHAWLGAAFFLSIPVIVKLSVTVYVDLGLVFFSTAALLLLFRWLETKQRRHLLLAGICCGLGIGTKYNGLLVLFILICMVPVLLIRSQEQRQRAALPAVKSASFFCFAALLAASPWLIKNAVWTGNPVHPLYSNVFSRAAVPSEENAADATATKGSAVRGVFATRYVLYGENIWQLLLLPVRIFFEGQDDDPRYFDGRLNPFLFLLPLLAFSCPADQNIRIEQTALAIFCLLYFLFAFNMEVLRIRYLVPMVPCLVILSIYGLHNLGVLANRHLQPHFAALIWLLPVGLLLTWNGSYIWQQFQKIDPFSYITGQLSRDEYLAKQLPEYNVMQHVNKKLPESAKILCVFMGWRGYYLNRSHLFDYHGNKNSILYLINRRGMTEGEIVRYFKVNNITHILIRSDMMEDFTHRIDNDHLAAWENFKNRYLFSPWHDSGFILYELKN